MDFLQNSGNEEGSETKNTNKKKFKSQTRWFGFVVYLVSKEKWKCKGFVIYLGLKESRVRHSLTNVCVIFLTLVRESTTISTPSVNLDVFYLGDNDFGVPPSTLYLIPQSVLT